MPLAQILTPYKSPCIDCELILLQPGCSTDKCASVLNARWAARRPGEANNPGYLPICMQPAVYPCQSSGLRREKVRPRLAGAMQQVAQKQAPKVTQDAVAQEVDNAGAIIEERTDEAVCKRPIHWLRDCFARLTMT